MFAINTHLLTEFGQDAAFGMVDTEFFRYFDNQAHSALHFKNSMILAPP